MEGSRVYLEITQQRPDALHLTIMGRGHVVGDGDQPIDEEVGSIFVTLKDSVGIEIIRQDESWTGSVEVTVR